MERRYFFLSRRKASPPNEEVDSAANHGEANRAAGRAGARGSYRALGKRARSKPLGRTRLKGFVAEGESIGDGLAFTGIQKSGSRGGSQKECTSRRRLRRGDVQHLVFHLVCGALLRRQHNIVYHPARADVFHQGEHPGHGQSGPNSAPSETDHRVQIPGYKNPPLPCRSFQDERVGRMVKANFLNPDNIQARLAA